MLPSSAVDISRFVVHESINNSSFVYLFIYSFEFDILLVLCGIFWLDPIFLYIQHLILAYQKPREKSMLSIVSDSIMVEVWYFNW